MRPLPRANFILMASLLSVGPLGAQTAAPPAATTAPSPGSAPADRPATPRVRPVSPAIAARLAEHMPKFTPPRPAANVADPSADSISPVNEPAAPESDRPRNTIVRLPNYVVREEKPEAFKARHLLTPRGRLALGFKRYPGLKFGSLPFFSNDGWALAMLEEDFRRERKAEMEDLVTLMTAPALREQVKTEVQKAFIRSGP